MSFVSPINTITLDCSGNVSPNSILLADVDLNKSNELLVGTQEGELLIFKAVRSPNGAQLWRRGHGLGFITAVTVGFLTTNTNEPRPIICVGNAEGAIHLFLLRSTVQRNRVRSAGGTMSGSRNDSKIQLHGSTSLSNDDEQQQIIQPLFSQQLVCNPKVLLIQDFNENEKQLIVAYSNRIIRVFTSMIIEEIDGRLSGRFVLKHIFNIPDQIHTLSSRRISTKDYELIVSQPGGNFLRFNPNEEDGRVLSTDGGTQAKTEWTEAIGVDKFLDETIYAMICQDRINIFSSALGKNSVPIPLSVKTGYLCGLQKGPVAKDNSNQLVTISSVDGDTFIIDRHSNITRFRPPLSSNTGCGGGNDSISNTNFFDQIQAFTSGLFGDNNMFCFIYVLTHNDKIIIVHSIEITNTKTTNLLTTLDEKYKQILSTPDKLKDLLHPRC